MASHFRIPPQIPSDWAEYRTNQGYTYYLNKITGQTQWENPYIPVVQPTAILPPQKSDVLQPAAIPFHQKSDTVEQPLDFKNQPATSTESIDDPSLSEIFDEESPYASFITLFNYPHLFDEYNRRKRQKCELNIQKSRLLIGDTKELSQEDTLRKDNQEVDMESTKVGSSSSSRTKVDNQDSKGEAKFLTTSLTSSSSSISEPKSSALPETLVKPEPERADLSDISTIKLSTNGTTAVAIDSDTSITILKGVLGRSSTIIVKDSKSGQSLYSGTYSSNSSSFQIRDCQTSAKIATLKRRSFHTSSVSVRLHIEEDERSNRQIQNVDIKCTSRKLEYSIRGENSSLEKVRVESKWDKSRNEMFRIIKLNVAGRVDDYIDPAYIVLLVLVADRAFGVAS